MKSYSTRFIYRATPDWSEWDSLMASYDEGRDDPAAAATTVATRRDLGTLAHDCGPDKFAPKDIRRETAPHVHGTIADLVTPGSAPALAVGSPLTVKIQDASSRLRLREHCDGAIIDHALLGETATYTGAYQWRVDTNGSHTGHQHLWVQVNFTNPRTHATKTGWMSADYLTGTLTPAAAITPTPAVDTPAVAVPAAPAPFDPFDFLGITPEDKKLTVPPSETATITLPEVPPSETATITEAEVPPSETATITEAEVPPSETATITEAEVPPSETATITEAEVPPSETATITEAEVPPSETATITLPEEAEVPPSETATITLPEEAEVPPSETATIERTEEAEVPPSETATIERTEEEVPPSETGTLHDWFRG